MFLMLASISEVYLQDILALLKSARIQLVNVPLRHRIVAEEVARTASARGPEWNLLRAARAR